MRPEVTHEKVLFKYDASAAGEHEVESMWTVPVECGWRLDNIPFYVRGVALEDIVCAVPGMDGELWYDHVLRPSGHSTVRLLFANEADVQEVRDQLRAIGCPSELSDLPRLVAVDIPPDVPYSFVRQKLQEWEGAGRIEYEEGCLGQGLPETDAGA